MLVDECEKNFHLFSKSFRSMFKSINKNYDGVELMDQHYPEYEKFNENGSFSDVVRSINDFNIKLRNTEFDVSNVTNENYELRLVINKLNVQIKDLDMKIQTMMGISGINDGIDFVSTLDRLDASVDVLNSKFERIQGMIEKEVIFKSETMKLFEEYTQRVFDTVNKDIKESFDIKTIDLIKKYTGEIINDARADVFSSDKILKMLSNVSKHTDKSIAEVSKRIDKNMTEFKNSIYHFIRAEQMKSMDNHMINVKKLSLIHI